MRALAKMLALMATGDATRLIRLMTGPSSAKQICEGDFDKGADTAFGTVASQILAQQPGSYRLSGRLWSDDTANRGMPRIEMRYAGADTPTAELRKAGDARSVAAARALSTGFVIPQGCMVQYVDVKFGSSMFVANNQGWVDGIAIDLLKSVLHEARGVCLSASSRLRQKQTAHRLVGQVSDCAMSLAACCLTRS
ncbi:hypothetical protein [Croceicoccus marinus]|jgi:hypothetical protein|uniref:Uncharacterized protein n=1 Tax=Croceicoccus marinus TaxID=450378 RepID=A0A7G6VUY8_9SPHN|nr:hypothetical protein [Croceicoccus marinus]QNE05553.1 hypothetical protein H4O24_02305 [Croceicoccus marinus]